MVMDRLSQVHKLPKPAKGFEHIERYWDSRNNLPAAKVLPGQLYVSLEGEMIATLLGSCISVAVRDTRKGVGGMNHFMLPDKVDSLNYNRGAQANNRAALYGSWAMESLINEILKAGGSRRTLEFTVFGGASLMKSTSNIGFKNTKFVKQYLKQEGFTVAAEDTGDIYPRKVLYFSDSGVVKVRRLKQIVTNTVAQREREYRQRLMLNDGQQGSIEWFE